MIYLTIIQFDEKIFDKKYIWRQMKYLTFDKLKSCQTKQYLISLLSYLLLFLSKLSSLNPVRSIFLHIGFHVTELLITLDITQVYAESVEATSDCLTYLMFQRLYQVTLICNSCSRWINANDLGLLHLPKLHWASLYLKTYFPVHIVSVRAINAKLFCSQ